MIGRHHVYNCLTAAAVGLAYGIDLPTVVRGLEAVECVPGRLQRIECGQPFGVFVDFAHTPDALTGCLQTLRQVTAGRVICVFGAGGDRDRQKRPLMGRAVESRRRPGRHHQRQSAQRRPAGDLPTRFSQGFHDSGGGTGDSRSRRGHPLGAGEGPAGRLRVDRRQRT